MEAFAMLLGRRAVRAFTDEVPGEDVVARVVEAGLYAPSGMGRQSAVVVAVTDRKTRDQLSRMNAAAMGGGRDDPFYGAPAVLVVLADRSKPTYLYDGALMMGNLLNAAHAAGLAGCWVHRAKQEFDSPEGKALLAAWGIQGDYEGIGHCILGYAAGSLPEAAPRREGRAVFVR